MRNKNSTRSQRTSCQSTVNKRFKDLAFNSNKKSTRVITKENIKMDDMSERQEVPQRINNSGNERNRIKTKGCYFEKSQVKNISRSPKKRRPVTRWQNDCRKNCQNPMKIFKKAGTETLKNEQYRLVFYPFMIF